MSIHTSEDYIMKVGRKTMRVLFKSLSVKSKIKKALESEDMSTIKELIEVVEDEGYDLTMGKWVMEELFF